MKRLQPLVLLVPMILLVLFASSADAATGINKTINFQGKLTNSDGTNVADDTYTVVFTLYDAASGGTVLWDETQNVTTIDGIFQVSLGSVDTTLGNVDFNSDSIYLGIKVGSDSEMTPRIRFAAVPYAFNAERLNGVTATQSASGFTLTGGTSTLKTLGVNNSLTFAGTDGTTITFQGTDTYVGRTTTDTLTNKTIGSTGLVFSGAAVDITTGTNEDFTLTPNGSGQMIFSTDFDSGLLIGSSSNTPAVLSVSGGVGANAAFILNQNNNGHIFAASSSGVTQFVIGQNGNVNIGTQSATTTPYKLYISDFNPATAAAMIENTAGLTGSGGEAECGPTVSCTVGLAIKMGTPGSDSNPGNKDRFLQFMRGDGLVVGKFQGNGTAGVAYTGSGADYAEYFRKEVIDEVLQPGDLVCLGATGGVTACTENSRGVIGVISDRAIVIGNDHEGDPAYVIVGLVGQLPVKVSNVNGSIQNGDPLTFSAIPGVAVKATTAGEIIGRATGSYDSEGIAVGAVDASVSRSWYDPDIYLLSAEDFGMLHSSESAEQESYQQLFQLVDSMGETVKRVGVFAEAAIGNIQVGYAEAQSMVITTSLNVRENIITGALTAGDVTAESLEVTTENISIGGLTLRSYITAIVRDVVSSETEKKENILTDAVPGLLTQASGEALFRELLEENVLSATASAVLSLSEDSTSSVSAETRDTHGALDTRGTLSLESLDVEGLATISSSLRVKENSLVEGVLTVVDTLMTKNVVISGLATFFDDVVFKSDVLFARTPTFSRDTAGFAVVKKGADRVEITFDQPYKQLPVVNASISLDGVEKETNETEETKDKRQQEIEEAVLGSDIQYIITKRTPGGFMILLKEPSTHDLNFSWTALAVEDVQTFKSHEITQSLPMPQPEADQPLAETSPMPTTLVPSPSPAGGNPEGEEVIEHEGTH